MQVPLSIRSSALAAFGLACLATPVLADDILVMPYTCAMSGGQPVLTRSPDHGHQIIGRREQRNFTACSPSNPGVCRHWTVHRFEMKCGNARVPWSAVVAAAGGPNQDRVFIEGGVLKLRMGPAWAMAADDPCAPGRSRLGRVNRYCADRATLSQHPLVEMPAGFAPMLALEGIFVADGPRSADPQLGFGAPTTGRATAAATGAPPPVKLAHVEPPAKPQPQVTSKVDPSPAVLVPKVMNKGEASHAAKAPTPEPAVIARAPVPPPPPPPPAMTPPPAPLPVPEAAPPLTTASLPTLSLPPASPAVPAPEPEPPKAAPAPEAPQTVPVTPVVAKLSAQAAALAGHEAPQQRAMSLFSRFNPPPIELILALAAATMILLAALLLTRSGARRAMHAANARDIGDVRFGTVSGTAPAAAPVGGPVLTAVPGPPTPRLHELPLPPTPTGMSASAPMLAGAVPITRKQALEVLGMGVAPDASQAALKRVVDGLRMTWHPDLAIDPADRLEREIRIKQINAAWDILSGRRETA